MARTVKVHEYAAKRDDILAAAERLIYTKGFEQMSIQDILDDLQMSKGAFYHYFASKVALLEALVKRMLDEMVGRLVPIVEDPHLSGIEKIRRYFAETFQWRSDRKDMLLVVLRVWYLDDNALVRQKVRAAMVEHFTALLTVVIRQGVQEGVFTAAYPEQVANVVVVLRMGLSETLAELLLSLDPRRDDLARIERTIAVYSDTIESVLGIAGAHLQLADAEILKTWLV